MAGIYSRKNYRWEVLYAESMNGQPESEQLQNFHERLNQWVSSQGFLFQLRYSLSGGGSRGALAFHFLKMLARVGIFVIIIAVGFWLFLFNQTRTAGYVEKLSASIKEKFSAHEIELKGFSRDQGEFYISRMAMIGGDETFFTGLELRNLKCNMGLLDSLGKNWDPGLIEINQADVSIRAGADSKETSKAIADVLFQDTGRVKITSIQVKDMSLKWGYSERTRGEIYGSKMRARKIPSGWSLSFSGGTFSQNWLKRLEIIELNVVFGPQGIVFEKALFKKGQGYVTLTDLKVKAGERPDISGKMNLRKMDISLLLPVGLRGFVEGNVSGDFKVFGSSNSSEGVGFEGDIVLEGEDTLILRDRVHLLRAFSVVDAFNNYHRVDFTNGSFNLKTHAGRLSLRNVNLKAGDLMTLQGGMVARIPTSEETLVLRDRDEFSEAILTEEELASGVDNVTLRGAAEQTRTGRDIGFGKVDEDSLFGRLGQTGYTRRIEEMAAERLTRSYRYEGRFNVTLKKEAFARAPQLAEAYPVSETTGRISIDVPIEGILYDLTMEQADEIYKNGTR